MAEHRTFNIELPTSNGIVLAAFLIVFVQCTTSLAQDELPEDIKKLGPKLVVNDVAKSSFSADGKKLVVGRMPFGSGLSIIDLAEGKATEITQEGKDPAWRPKGKDLIAYVQKNGGEEEVWVVTPAGEKPRKITAGGFPTWSADGGTLYCQARTSAKVLAIDVDAEEPKVKEEIEIPFFPYPAVSPDGQLVAYFNESKLHIYDIKAKKVARIWPVPGWSGMLPAWSPDSKQVAFGTYGYGDGAGLWLLNVPDARVTEIAKGSFTMGVWSNDGKQFAFDLREGPKKHRVLVIDATKLVGMDK